MDNDKEIVDEVIYLINEYYSKKYTREEFEGKVQQLVYDGQISERAAKTVVGKIFTFEHDPKYGLVWNNDGCGGWVKKPHWKPKLNEMLLPKAC